jgi:hypothetical protein
VPSAGAASGASTCSSPPAPASACCGSGGGRSGSVTSASAAGSWGVGSSWAAGSGAGVTAADFGLSFTALADLMKSSHLSYKSKRAEYLLCNKTQTYSIDFFMTAFFTRIARRGVLVAGGGVTPADGAVPAMVMVTVAAAAGSVPISWSSGLGGEAGGLQMENVSMQQY